jgi:glycosyltransferase involved in cell wall biosynthesis
MQNVRRSVLLVVENLPVPYDRRVWQEALALSAAGYRVSVLSPATPHFPKRAETIEGIAIFRYPMLIEGETPLGIIAEYFWSFVCIFFGSIYIALRRGFHILHLANPPDIFFPIAFFWRILGKKIVFDHHDLTPELFVTKFGERRLPLLQFFYFAERMTFRAAHKVICTNESYREIALGRGRRRPEDVAVVRNAPDAARFRRLPPEPGLKQGAKYLVTFLGEIGEQDGVDVLVRALKRMRLRLGDGAVHCAILGGGPFFDRLIRYAADEGVADMMTFTGRADNETICRFLSTTDVAVDPCPYSPHADVSTATKIMEYMFFELPIVAFDLTETRRSAGAAAIYAGRNDEADFADRIIDLLNAAERRHSLGAAARSRLDADLAWSNSVKVLTATMDGLAAAR